MSDLEKLFAARHEIDRALLEQHSRDMAVLFTDIVGSTQFYETHGDIAGLALVRRHNDLLFPVVAENGGHVVKTVGDAIMATFEDPPQAVRCAVQMQRVLAHANLDSQNHEIHIRAGAHAGRVMLDGDDVYGDAVNTAARVAHAAGGDEVLVSQSLFERLGNQTDLIALPREPLQMKGKQEPMAVVSVLWQRDAQTQLAEPNELAVGQIFMLELGLGRQGLRVAAVDGEADKSAVKAYGEMPLSTEDIDVLGQRFKPFVHGKGSVPYTKQIQDCGKALYQQCLTDRARRRLENTEQGFLRLHVDDQLVHLPWELMHDGTSFAGRRFAIGRMVSARLDESAIRLRDTHAARRALVVSNPSGDLPDAAREGSTIADLLRSGFGGEVVHLEGPVTREQFLAAIVGCRLLHFAGHARRSSENSAGGLQLADGVASAADLSERLEQMAPSLVFANSCHASTGDGWFDQARGVHSLASALLCRGTRHYLAPMWGVADDDALAFALRVYEQALTGAALGEAVRLARCSLHAPASFGGYVLYGDPRGLLVKTASASTPRKMRSSTTATFAKTPDGTASTSSPENAEACDTADVDNAPADNVDVSSSDEVSSKRFAHPSATHKAEFQQRVASVVIAAAVVLVALLAVGGWWLVSQHDTGDDRDPAQTAASNTTESSNSGTAKNDTQNIKASGESSTDVKPSAAQNAALATGLIRLSILPFKNLTGDSSLDFLCGGIAETLVTDFGQSKDFRLIERGLIDVDIKEIEFAQSRFVDPETRAAIGKIVGAEVVVLGGFQRAGNKVRASARLIHVETGEILQAVRVEQTQQKLFELQDQLAKDVRDVVPQVASRLRP